MHFAHIEQNVNMIAYSSYDNIRRIEVPNYGRQISMDARSNLFVEKRFPILRAENQMCVQLRE